MQFPSQRKFLKKRINSDAIVKLKNARARVLENSRIWEKPNVKNQNTRPHCLTNRVR